ncbi:hypothetical protein [Saccharopolyspora taberi]|uniref:Uncharacterized protein n=1 Tax=Saccharopolyspora taberi TaxID=60895 RepID=A0ABN3VHS2_9PSEU
MPPDDNMLSVPRGVYEHLVTQAAAWRDLRGWLRTEFPRVALLAESPHVRELIREWVEWDRRRGEAAASHSIADLADWRQVGVVPSFAELERRRRLPGVLAKEAYARRGGYGGGPVDWATGRPLHPGQSEGA